MRLITEQLPCERVLLPTNIRSLSLSWGLRDATACLTHECPR